MPIEVPREFDRLGAAMIRDSLAPVLTYPSMEQLDLGEFAAGVQDLVDRRVGAPSPVAVLVP